MHWSDIPIPRAATIAIVMMAGALAGAIAGFLVGHTGSVTSSDATIDRLPTVSVILVRALPP